MTWMWIPASRGDDFEMEHRFGGHYVVGWRTLAARGDSPCRALTPRYYPAVYWGEARFANPPLHHAPRCVRYPQSIAA
jgi:hypothetical protein